jgi:hypothetical protein
MNDFHVRETLRLGEKTPKRERMLILQELIKRMARSRVLHMLRPLHLHDPQSDELLIRKAVVA